MRKYRFEAEIYDDEYNEREITSGVIFAHDLVQATERARKMIRFSYEDEKVYIIERFMIERIKDV